MALVLAIGVSLGSFGTAAASGLTAQAVKKIAGKVVAKKAKKLSVAHATTADTATALAPSAAATLGVRPYVFSLTSGTVAASHFFQLPGVPAGTYLVSASVEPNTTTGSYAECVIRNQTNTTTYLDMAAQAGGGSFPSLNGVGVMTLAAGDQAMLFCSVATTWTPFHPLVVAFTPMASETSLAISPTRSGTAR